MSDSASSAEGDKASDQEDPLIEIPTFAGNELVKKSQLSRMDIRGLVVRCTSCLHQINHHDPLKLKKHIKLGVILCSDCYDFYGTSEFSQDESGNYNYCTWCGNGGKLYLCDFCPNTFCGTCVRRNIGRAAVSEMSKEGWKCYCCDLSKLKHKVAFCDLIVEYSKNAKKKEDRKSQAASELIKLGKTNWPEGQACLLSAFESVDDSCNSFHRRIEKLKDIGISRSKSLKHIITKFEEIVNTHRQELSYKIKSLSRQYLAYIDKQKKLDGNHKNSTESTDNNLTENVRNKKINGDDGGNSLKTDITDVQIKNSEDSKNESNLDDDTLKTKDDNYKAKLSLLNEAEELGINGDDGGNSLKTDDITDVQIKNSEDSKNESNLDDDTLKTKDDNYKAKLSLLNEAESSLSEIEDILTEGILMSDSDAENSKIGKTKTEENPLENKDEKTSQNNEENSPESKEEKQPESKEENGPESTEVKQPESTEEKQPESKEEKQPENKEEKQPERKENGSESHNKIETISKDSDSDIAEIFSSTSNKVKKCVNRKLDFDALSSESISSAGNSESSIYLSSGGELESKPKKVKKFSRKSKPRITVTKDDPKLKMTTNVLLKRCDDLLPNGETTIPLPASIILEDLDKEIKSLIKDPIKREKKKLSDTDKKKKPKEIKKPKVPKKKISDSSSSISLSSSEEEEGKKKLFQQPLGDDPNTIAKKKLLSTSSGESSVTDASEESEEAPKKKKSKKSKAESGSSDEFQPKKKKKFDKLLHKRILSDDDSDFEGPKKGGERKKQTKRKKIASDDSKSEHKKNSDETSTDSDSEKEKKKKKRKRIKKVAASSSEEGDKNDKEEEPGSQNTPGKGRKNIKKILSKKDLAMETKEAQNLERERRRRVQERQKMYNVITDTTYDGTEVITRKMVLEVDPTSKEEIVEIHPDLVEKLKPHQVNGVKFMWECTIESLKQLEKEKGSGCILAHCMGLGKTLQVITFLHTCLTNKHVNKHIRTAMVICPYNTVLNWSKELDYWLGEVEGNVLVHELTLAKDNYSRVDVLEYWQREGGILIISYDLFRRLVLAKIKGLKSKGKAVLHSSLVDPGPDIVVCDEGHVLKNVASAVSKACSSITTQRRIVLTGTPLQNNLLEYHCMLSFVKPHLLGTPKEFRNRFVNPIMNGQYDDSTEHDVKRMKKRIHILHKLLEGCVQRCDYGALTKFLPTKHEFVISVKLSEIQIKLYRWYLDNKSNSKTQEKIQGSTLFNDYNILRNLCTHPCIIIRSHERAEKRRLMKEDEEEEEEFINDESEESSNGGSGSSEVDEVVRKYKTRSRQNCSGDEVEEEPEIVPEKTWFDDFISEEDRYKIELSGKMVLLVDILKECEAIGDKVIVFSQSLLTFDLIEDLLSYLDQQPVTEEEEARDIRFTWKKNADYFRMDGSTSAEFRKQYIDHFNDPAHDRARLFLVSTKAGGLGTNLVGANRVIMLDASWNPSHDVQAIFRVYRFGQKKPVYIYRFLAQGTMEEKIYDRQVTKLSLSIRVVDEQQIDRHFNQAELSELYNFEPESLPNRPTPMVPKDTLLAEMLMKHKDWIVAYHEHDSLLQNETEEDLTEEERKAAWTEYENEREGRYMAEEMNLPLEDTIKGFCKEPDFNEAVYEGSVIPTAKSMIESIISAFRKMYPTSSAAELRKKLQIAIFTLRALFQEKHVKILRMKQEYVAKGSVPLAVNKYLEELNQIVSDLTMHYDNVTGLVNKDVKLAHQAQDAFQQQVNQMRFANAQFGNNTMFTNTVPNQPRYNINIANAANFAQRYPQFGQVRLNPAAAANFKQSGVPWTNRQAYTDMLARMQRHQQATAAAQQKKNMTPEPVITEVEINEPKQTAPTNNSHSTVQITEIE